MMNLQKMMKQVQKMQGDMARVQEELKSLTVEGSAGGGAVKVEANGAQQIQKITISPEVVDPGDVVMLEDLVLAAINEALRRSTELAQSEMAKVTGGMNLYLPGMPSF